MTLCMKIELRFAASADVSALRRNWRACFGDDDTYLDFFFARRFRAADTPVLTADGTVVSQLFLLPAKLRDAAGEMHDVRYLFAAATHPDHRGRGCMARLLRFAAEAARNASAEGIALQPGEESLYAYYAQFGYRPAFRRRVWEGSLCDLPDTSVPNDPEADAVAFLERYLNNRPGVCWEREALRFAIDEHRRFRGRCAACGRAFAAAEDDGVCRVLSDPDDLAAGIALLRGLTHETRVRLILPPDAPLGEPEDGGMLLAFTPIDVGEAMLCFAKE